MNEDRYRSMLGDFVEDSLRGPERREVEDHVKTCESCRATVEDLAEIRKAAASLGRLSPPQAVWERVQDSIRSQSVETGSRGSAIFSFLSRSDQPFSIASHRWALAATLLVLLGALVLALRARLSSRPSTARGQPGVGIGGTSARRRPLPECHSGFGEDRRGGPIYARPRGHGGAKAEPHPHRRRHR